MIGLAKDEGIYLLTFDPVWKIPNYDGTLLIKLRMG